MNTRYSAPLVSTSLEEAREQMISEGAALTNRETQQRELEAVFGKNRPWQDKVSEQFYQNPLLTLGAAFAFGAILGASLGSSRSRF